MKQVAARATRMRGSGIRELMMLALATPGVVRLETGDPDLPTPEHIVAAAAEAARSGYTKYTPTAGIAPLREAITRKLKRVNRIEVGPEQVVVSHGGVSGLAVAIQSLVDPGDEVLVPDPGWPPYSAMVILAGARQVPYALDRAAGYQINLAALERLVTPATKVLLINSPGNPTGAVFEAEVVEAVVEFASRHDLFLLSDEVYDETIFEGEHVSPARFDSEGRVISVFSFSKTYAMTGWRVGYVVASAALAALFTKVQEPLIACASAISQKAAEAALEGPQDCVGEMRGAYQRRRDLTVSLLQEAGLFVTAPQGALYVLANISAASSDTYAFATGLVRDHGVSVAPGETFGPQGAGLVRISLTSPEAALREGIGRLAQGVAAATASQA